MQQAGIRLGCGEFGMSSVPEAMCAKAIGMEVFGLSCITNLAAGMQAEKLFHDDVTSVAKKFSSTFEKLVLGIVSFAFVCSVILLIILREPSAYCVFSFRSPHFLLSKQFLFPSPPKAFQEHQYSLYYNMMQHLLHPSTSLPV